MTIIEFWKQYIDGKTNSEFNKKDILNALDKYVPDWKEEIRDREKWDSFHTYGSYMNEMVFTDIIIEELGLEFCYFLIDSQFGKRHNEASSALAYCSKCIVSDWDNFPESVQQKILTYDLKNFLSVCFDNPHLWNGLTKYQKSTVLFSAISEERAYVSDYILYYLWSHEMNFKDSRLVKFATEDFSRLKHDVLMKVRENARGGGEDIIIKHLGKWTVPQVGTILDSQFHYVPSERVLMIKQVLAVTRDEEFTSLFNSKIDEIKSHISTSSKH